LSLPVCCVTHTLLLRSAPRAARKGWVGAIQIPIYFMYVYLSDKKHNTLLEGGSSVVFLALWTLMSLTYGHQYILLDTQFASECLLSVTLWPVDNCEINITSLTLSSVKLSLLCPTMLSHSEIKYHLCVNSICTYKRKLACGS
jgi:hypothetical protein